MRASGHRFEAQLDARLLTLTTADREWFSRLRMTMWTRGWWRERAAINDQLVVMLDDLEEAEQAGLSAQQFFGRAPVAMAQAILRELPPAPVASRVGVGIALAATGWLTALVLRAPLGQALALNPWVVLAVMAWTAAAGLSLVALLDAMAFATGARAWGWRAAGLGWFAAWLAGVAGLGWWDLHTWHWGLGRIDGGGELVIIASAVAVGLLWAWLSWRRGARALGWLATLLFSVGVNAAQWYNSGLTTGPSALTSWTVYGLFAGGALLYLVVAGLRIRLDQHL